MLSGDGASLYVTSDASSASIYKINVATMTVTGSVALPAGTHWSPQTMLAAGAYAYVPSYGAQTKVVRVNMDTMTAETPITLAADESWIITSALSSNCATGYFVSECEGTVVGIDLQTMTTTGTVDLRNHGFSGGCGSWAHSSTLVGTNLYIAEGNDGAIYKVTAP